MKIRQEKAEDQSFVYEVNEEAFGRKDEAGLVNALRKDQAFIPELSLVAENDGQLVGHILFTRLEIIQEGHTYPSLALAPMAVLSACQHSGIGSKLIKEGLKRARQAGYRSVIVLGHESYYPRFGFEPASRWGIKAPFEVPDAAFMALPLAEDGLEGVSGTVRYAASFGI
ncbi:GNAT family N-acetyltransferase [Roseivirga sp. BDSF3-8]|uniref:GNAT family N-acetyltransferase n=1 Tax=Roseivirga sp. BDSF3-8 TaxID=3241598 RepID=UPI0035319708